MKFAVPLTLLLCATLHGAHAAAKKNVLLITVDDLRPQIGPYGMAETMTPNLDAFAKGAAVFQRAYCQMAVCSPSRNSFMSGRRPDKTKVWNVRARCSRRSRSAVRLLLLVRMLLTLPPPQFINHFRELAVGPDWITMPEYFKKAGYLAYASGKLYVRAAAAAAGGAGGAGGAGRAGRAGPAAGPAAAADPRPAAPEQQAAEQ